MQLFWSDKENGVAGGGGWVLVCNGYPVVRRYVLKGISQSDRAGAEREAKRVMAQDAATHENLTGAAPGPR